MSNSIPTVGFLSSETIIKAGLVANQSVLLIGDPGIGKSSIMRKVAADLNMPLHTLLGATLDPTDIGGLPVKAEHNGKTHVVRLPLKMISDLSESPGLLFLDEISAAPGPVQAALLRLILDRVAGDVELHPDTRIVAAANPPEQAPAGFELSAPLMGRLCVIHFRPAESEILRFFRSLGDDDSAERDEGEVFSAIADASPDMLEVDIPKAAATGGMQWGSPRSWERAVRMRAAFTKMGLDPDSDEAFHAVAGSVGQSRAAAYYGVRRLIGQLPSVEEIVKDPEGAKVPERKDLQVAAVGLMPRIAKANLWAAYIYAMRLMKEYALASHRTLMEQNNKATPAMSDPLTKKGLAARVELTKMINSFRR